MLVSSSRVATMLIDGSFKFAIAYCHPPSSFQITSALFRQHPSPLSSPLPLLLPVGSMSVIHLQLCSSGKMPKPHQSSFCHLVVVHVYGAYIIGGLTTAVVHFHWAFFNGTAIVSRAFFLILPSCAYSLIYLCFHFASLAKHVSFIGVNISERKSRSWYFYTAGGRNWSRRYMDFVRATITRVIFTPGPTRPELSRS